MRASREVRVGTRGSALALTQTRWVIARLRERAPEVSFQEVVIRTAGDRSQDRALAQVGGKGLFVKEIEEALLRGEVDFAVHSLKDLPTALPEGLVLAAVPLREDPADALVLPLRPLPASQSSLPLPMLPEGAQVGTSSLRRRAQLQHVRPDLRPEEIRGNLDTRLRRLEEGAYDALVLAAAGLRRMNWSQRVSVRLPPEVCLSAPGQGALALEARAEDHETCELLGLLHDQPTAIAVRAERAFLQALGGGCQLPIGALAERNRDNLVLTGMVATADGRRKLYRRLPGAPRDPEGLGRQLANMILQEGGRDILRE